MKGYIKMAVALLLTLTLHSVATASGKIAFDNLSLTNVNGGKSLHFSADILLDSLSLKSNEHIFVTPVMTGSEGHIALFPTVLVTGRGMHFAYERGTMRGLKKYRQDYDIVKEIERHNGKAQKIGYTADVAMQPWMRTEPISIGFRYDNCGCGVFSDSSESVAVDTTLNPVKQMKAVYLTPAVTELPISIHEGKATVQFEVNRTELHDSPYRCANGQQIDNRDQLKVIKDSIEYALTDPNVEIAKIEIIGNASPESPYLHNLDLATRRSRALAEYIDSYIGNRYQLPVGITGYDAVAENWKEFREQVLAAKDISEAQREALLELIDRPVNSPADYDAKETELKTDPKFSTLYRTKILPQWFPHLRSTHFRISTRLKPMDDRQLAEVMSRTPEKMSLNQMMRVARLYPEGSEEFNKAIETAGKYYPDSEEANLNMAVMAVNKGDYAEAGKLIEKAGNSPQAVNVKAILLTEKGDFEGAQRLLDTISDLPAAGFNRQLIEY